MFCHRALRGGLRGRAGGIGLCTKTAAAPSSSPPSALARLSRLPKRHPFALAVGLTCCKTAAADIMTQRFIEGKEELDWRRTAIFAAFGTCYLGAFQYALLTKLVPRLLPGVAAFIDKPLRAKLADRVGLRNLGLQLLVEPIVNSALFYFPTFYIIKAHVEGVPEGGSAVAAGLATYGRNVKEDLLAVYAAWLPFWTLNYAFAPLWLRIPFTACYSFGWCMVLSFNRGAPEASSELSTS